MASAIGTALFCSVLQPMAAKAMDIIKDKGKAIARSMADNAMDNIKRDISRLQTTLYTIEGIVQVAEEKQIDKQGKPVIFIRNWLRDLADVGYEARDVLDDFITFSSCIITAYEEASNPVNFISSLMLSYVGGLSDDTSNIPLAILNRLEKNIRSVRERFDEKKKEGKTIKKEGSESVKNRRPEVGPSTNKQSDYKFVEREEMKEGIMEKILHPEYDRVDVVAIWGMGGIGKTTLAQSIYNDERVNDQKVPRSWLFVGENKFSAEKVIREILNDKKTIGIGKLQEKLKEKLRGDRFLIVLDDVWDVDGSEWSLLFNPLTEVGKGGLIIITSRVKEVCPELIKSQTAYNLEPLSEKDSWSLFESCAYKDGKSDSTPDLECIGKEIVKKLNGLPLALRVVGCSLLAKDSNTWTNFLESNEWKLRDDDEVMSALIWSYNLLPRHLKTCFTYCALFPKDHVLDKKVLVEMWMAHDLIQTEDQKRRPEDVGADYFKELVNASLLQRVDGKHVMHDLIHDLALLVSNGEFATANGSLSIDQMVRHITITTGDFLKIPRLCKIEKLLTLYITDDEIDTTDDEKFDYSVLDVFKQLKSIRVLVLSDLYIREILDCISELRHLRYLDVSETSVERLPDSLCRLYNLQMIAAPYYHDHDIVKLPREIVNISSLRYIRANLSTCKGVGKLTSLQELSSIHVCEGDNIRELGVMPQLRGKLTIKGLGNVEKLEDDVGALMEKQKLMDELELEFLGPYEFEFNQDFAKSTISAQVLNALGCPPNLKILKIYGYTGVKPPSWMVDGKHRFDKLQKLELSHCRKLEFLPPLGEFDKLQTLKLSFCLKLESLPLLGELTSLKHLFLENVEVKRLGDEFYGKFTDDKVFFPSLESLSFSFMKEWEEWDDIIIKNSSVSFFPRLTKLEIKNCDKLVSVLPVVKNSIMNVANFMKSLSHLEISYCDGLKRLQLDALVSLKELDISYCKRLVQITSAICEKLQVSSCKLLKKMDVARCDGLVVIKILKLDGCGSLRSLSIDIHGLDSLERLDIIKCPKLESLLPLGELTSLKHLFLEDVGVKRLGDEFYGKFTDDKIFFPSLESLSFSFMKEWEEWDDIIIKNSSVSFFPRLTKLEIKKCDKLVSVLPVVKNSIMNVANFMKSLSRLEISYCDGLKRLQLDALVSLKELDISYCKRLVQITSAICEKLQVSSCKLLKKMDAARCDGLVVIKILKLKGCESLRSLSIDIHGLDSLERLDIINCPKLESLPSLGELTSLKHLCLWKVGVKRLGDEFYGKFTDDKIFFPSLESLRFYHMKEWKEWDDIIIENSSVSFFPRLTSLEIKYCLKLVSVLPVVKNAANFMTSLSRLEIFKCDGLKWLQLDALVSLKKLDISSCKSLVHITSAISEKLQISSCRLLEKMDVARFDSLVVIKILKLEGCESLKSLSIDIHGLDSLERLDIINCPKLESLPPFGEFDKLQTLVLHMRHMLESLLPLREFDKLQTLQLSFCLKLESLLPFGELTSLKHLFLEDVGVKRLGDEFYGKFTDGKVFFPSLESLSFSSMGEWKEWDDIIIEYSSVSFFPRLTKLIIFLCPELVSVLPVVKNPIMNAANFMASLSHLEIYYCKGLRSLPADGFPPSLSRLIIKGCPLLYERYNDESGPDRHKIDHIPNKYISFD